MAESMAGLKRSCRCAEVTEANVGQEMTLMGWVQKSRNKGGIIFTDLRDRSGIIQIIFEESDCGAESFAKAEKLRSEFTVAVVGTIEKRSGAANPNLKTGTIEMRAKSLRILSESEVPPFRFYHYRWYPCRNLPYSSSRIYLLPGNPGHVRSQSSENPEIRFLFHRNRGDDPDRGNGSGICSFHYRDQIPDGIHKET